MTPCSLLAPLFLSLVPSPQESATSGPRAIPTPHMAQPVAPIFAQLGEGGATLHRLPLPPGEWLVRVASAEFEPRPYIDLVGGIAPENQGIYLWCGAARVSLDEGKTVQVRIAGRAADVGASYCLTVHPLRPRPVWRPLVRQVLELGPDYTFPLPSGSRCAAPVTAMLRAGQRYRVSARSADMAVRVLVPAQNGLAQRYSMNLVESFLATDFEDACAKADSAHVFLAPKDALYVFWCLSEDSEESLRATCTIETSDPADEGLFPEGLLPDRFEPALADDAVVLWRRPDLWLAEGDPEVFVPLPARKKVNLAFTTTRSDSTATFLPRTVEGVEFSIPVAPRTRELLEVTMVDGEPGLWLKAKGATGPIDVELSTSAAGATRDPDSVRHLLLELPAILRGRAEPGSVVSVAALGAGCSPQVVVHGAGVRGQCNDATGYSTFAITEGLATHAGEVEVLLAAAVAEPGATALVRTQGFSARIVGATLGLDPAALQWLSTPGDEVLTRVGAWSHEDELLPSGASVDWLRVPMKAGHVYRILAAGAQTPELVLDVPGSGRSSAVGGVAILLPAADGEATLGVAAPGSESYGDYAVSVCDLGLEVAPGTDGEVKR